MDKYSVERAISQPVFSFGEHKVRVVMRDGEPWFVAADVAEALGYRNAPDAARNLGDHQKASTQIVRSTSGGNPNVTIINESGLYRLVLRSRKPEAEKFSDWVTGEVLPAIRKTGIYVGKPFAVNPDDVLTQEEQNTLRLMLTTAADRMPKEKRGTMMIQGWSKLKAHFKVGYREIPRAEFSEAVSIVARHTAEWEVVDEPATSGTLNETVERLVKQVETPNGAPAIIFMPLVNAVLRKQGFIFLLSDDQTREVVERLERLAEMFHPHSKPFTDVLGVQRVLRGQHPVQGNELPRYRQVIPRIAAGQLGGVSA